ncbi:MAG: Sua5/YciO/YrdC/YwlC family protein, partial [Oscillospiraceae bacterium]|nr:Sua5/YciO/YrdC/YwlC family protein [Oscillospiraceae bacterium]
MKRENWQIRLENNRLDTLVFHQEIGCCADIIRQGGLVSVPTETVYGLAGDALNTDAV